MSPDPCRQTETNTMMQCVCWRWGLEVSSCWYLCTLTCGSFRVGLVGGAEPCGWCLCPRFPFYLSASWCPGLLWVPLHFSTECNGSGSRFSWVTQFYWLPLKINIFKFIFNPRLRGEILCEKHFHLRWTIKLCMELFSTTDCMSNSQKHKININQTKIHSVYCQTRI